MIERDASSGSFGGRTYRILSGQSAVWVDYFQLRLPGEEPPASVDLPIDYWDFTDEPKLGPAIVYRRVLSTSVNPLLYFTGNQSAALVSTNLSVLDASSEPEMAEADFWAIITTSLGLSWADRIDQVISSLRARSVSDILGFHRTLKARLSALAHPLRSVVIGNGEVEGDSTEAAIAAILLSGRDAFESHLMRPDRLEHVDGLQVGDVLNISRRALREGHGIDARIVSPPPSVAGVEESHFPLSQSEEEIEREAAYRARLYGFRDVIWDSDQVAEWLSARALVLSEDGVVELVLLVARKISEELSHTVNRVLDRIVLEGSLVAGVELARPLIARPGFRTPPIFGIATPKTSPLSEYLISAGYLALTSASLSTNEINPRWASVACGSKR